MSEWHAVHVEVVIEKSLPVTASSVSGDAKFIASANSAARTTGLGRLIPLRQFLISRFRKFWQGVKGMKICFCAKSWTGEWALKADGWFTLGTISVLSYDAFVSSSVVWKASLRGATADLILDALYGRSSESDRSHDEKPKVILWSTSICDYHFARTNCSGTRCNSPWPRTLHQSLQ